MATDTPVNELLAVLHAYRHHKSQRLVAKAMGISQPLVHRLIKEAERRGVALPPPGGSEAATGAADLKLPRAGKVKRYIFTCAQDNTKLHEPTWRNLIALARYYDAAVHVSTFCYNKDALGQGRLAKRRIEANESEADYPKEIVQYMSNERVNITGSLTWCGELQISPTARRPLTGFETYTFRRSTIIPHTTVALAPVPAVKGEGVKLLYTTGTVTQRNYIQRRVGFQAEHFHSYGALLIEVDAQGAWWARHLIQGPDGAMHDLDVRAINGKVERQTKAAIDNGFGFVADIGWGDVHARQVDPVVAHVSWGAQPDSMLNALHPSTQHVHDILDNTPISHHTRRDAHETYYNHIHKDRRSIVAELRITAAELNKIHRTWCKTRVVCSNHDGHLQRWLREEDWRDDMENAEQILMLNFQILRALRKDDKKFYIVEDALRRFGADPAIRFMRQDERDVILEDVIDGGIETVHGDKGANGAKGTLAGVAKTSRPTNMADKHAFGIMDYAYMGGTSTLLDCRYNKGFTTWTQGHTVTYANGTRTIVAVWRGKWRA